MNKILSLTRRCVEDYDMIHPGDRIAVGVSGGKDSLMLLAALARLREFYPVPFTVEALTLDMGHAEGVEGLDFSPIRGPEGNIEYLGFLQAGAGEKPEFDLKELVDRSHQALKG